MLRPSRSGRPTKGVALDTHCEPTGAPPEPRVECRDRRHGASLLPACLPLARASHIHGPRLSLTAHAARAPLWRPLFFLARVPSVAAARACAQAEEEPSSSAGAVYPSVTSTSEEVDSKEPKPPKLEQQWTHGKPGVDVSSFAETTFFCLGRDTFPRKQCIYVITQPWFDQLVLTVILLNCVTMSVRARATGGRSLPTPRASHRPRSPRARLAVVRQSGAQENHQLGPR